MFLIILGCHCQVWGVLPETVPEKGELEGLRPTQNLEEDPMEDREETMTSPEPQPPKCPGEYGNGDFRGVSDSF